MMCDYETGWAIWGLGVSMGVVIMLCVFAWFDR